MPGAQRGDAHLQMADGPGARKAGWAVRAWVNSVQKARSVGCVYEADADPDPAVPGAVIVSHVQNRRHGAGASGAGGVLTMGFDGGSRPGEGGGAAAHVVDEDGVVLWAARRYIAGQATNQLAESEAFNMGARKVVELVRARGATLIRMYGDSMFVLRAVAGQLVCSDAAIGASTGETAAIVRSAACDVQLIHVPRERNSGADRGAGAAQDLRASADSDVVGVAMMDMQRGVEPSVAALPRGGAGSDGCWDVDYEVEGFSEQHVRLPQVACVDEVRRGVTQAAAKLLDMARRARLMERVGEGHRTTILSAGAFGSGEFLGVFPGSRPTGGLTPCWSWYPTS